LAGTDPYEIVSKVALMLKKGNGWGNPFGDGEAGRRIIQVIREKYD
jgi:UDP-N-acetylglucosamine 2-epimerase